MTVVVSRPWLISRQQSFSLPGKIISKGEVMSDAQSTDRILRSAFDLIWNACGFNRSPDFDEQALGRLHGINDGNLALGRLGTRGLPRSFLNGREACTSST